MNEMTYKGYTARVEYDSEDKIFFGRVIDIRDIVDFEGQSVDELESSFHEIIDFYIESCRMRGSEPESPVDGRMVLKLPPALLTKLSTISQQSGKSVSSVVVDVLQDSTLPLPKEKRKGRRPVVAK